MKNKFSTRTTPPTFRPLRKKVIYLMAIPLQTRILTMAVVATILSCGCAANRHDPDPFKSTNREIYKFNEGIDRVALKPAADAYVKYIPKPIRTGLGNGFDNITYFNVIANDVLQAKWRQGLSDTGRMAANSTIGVAGIFDVASGWGLPAHENDFGVTLGKWGVGPGPYLVLPLLGPSTVRDAPRYVVEYFATPTTYLWLPYSITVPLDAVFLVDERSRADIIVRFRNDTAIDPYVFTRNAYLQYREARIHEFKPAATPDQSLYDLDTDSGPPTKPSTKP
ncbi:MAG TPA: VacJ family lipoprotein [Tepidisphaeraceae bacterium]|jgi:phospholipid-binding lipoprotein MlaA|nr:VacJ family lipoprotein [Tepidisphaeraceae bacterium]